MTRRSPQPVVLEQACRTRIYAFARKRRAAAKRRGTCSFIVVTVSERKPRPALGHAGDPDDVGAGVKRHRNFSPLDQTSPAAEGPVLDQSTRRSTAPRSSVRRRRPRPGSGLPSREDASTTVRRIPRPSRAPAQLAARLQIVVANLRGSAPPSPVRDAAVGSVVCAPFPFPRAPAAGLLGVAVCRAPPSARRHNSSSPPSRYPPPPTSDSCPRTSAPLSSSSSSFADGFFRARSPPPRPRARPARAHGRRPVILRLQAAPEQLRRVAVAARELGEYLDGRRPVVRDVVAALVARVVVGFVEEVSLAGRRPRARRRRAVPAAQTHGRALPATPASLLRVRAGGAAYS